MNYYNPYFYTMPQAFTQSKVGLFSRLFGGRGINFSSIISGTQKTLNFINQAIPAVRQVTPIVKNAKTMFKVMNEFKRSDNNKNSTSVVKEENNIINNTIETNNLNDNSISNDTNFPNNGPTFFM